MESGEDRNSFIHMPILGSYGRPEYDIGCDTCIIGQYGQSVVYLLMKGFSSVHHNRWVDAKKSRIPISCYVKSSIVSLFFHSQGVQKMKQQLVSGMQDFPPPMNYYFQLYSQ